MIKYKRYRHYKYYPWHVLEMEIEVNGELIYFGTWIEDRKIGIDNNEYWFYTVPLSEVEDLLEDWVLSMEKSIEFELIKNMKRLWKSLRRPINHSIQWENF